MIAALERLREGLTAATRQFTESGEAEAPDELGEASEGLGDVVAEAFDEEAESLAAGTGRAPFGAAPAPGVSMLARARGLAAETAALVETLRELRAAFGELGRSFSGAPDAREPGLGDDAEVARGEGADGLEPSAATSGGEGGVEADAGPAPVEEVTGLVTDDGQPVAGVELIDEDTGERATTDVNGVYRLSALTSSATLRLAVRSRGGAVMHERIAVGQGRGRVADLELPRSGGAHFPTSSHVRVLGSRIVTRGGAAGAGVVEGVVLGADGRPAPRALVRLDERTWARTDTRGTYRFLRVGPGMHTVGLVGGGGPSVARRVRVTSGLATVPALRMEHGLRASTPVARTPAGSSLVRGRVVDEAGHPVDRARVVLVSSVPHARPVAVRTGILGAFAFRNLARGPHRLVVQRPGYETASRPLQVTAGNGEEVRVSLHPSNGIAADRLRRSTRPAPPAVAGRRTRDPAPPAVAARDGRTPAPPAVAARSPRDPAPPAVPARDRRRPAPPTVAAGGEHATARELRGRPAAASRTAAHRTARSGAVEPRRPSVTSRSRTGVGERSTLVVTVQDSRGRNMEGEVVVKQGSAVVGRKSTTGGRCVIHDVPAGHSRVSVRTVNGLESDREVVAVADRETSVRLVVAR